MKLNDAFELQNKLEEEYDACREKHKEVCDKKFHAYCKLPLSNTHQVKRTSWPDWKGAFIDDETGRPYFFSMCVYAMPKEEYRKAIERNYLTEEEINAEDWMVDSYDD